MSARASSSRTSARTSATVAGSLLLDATLVVGFAATGRASHDEPVLSGLWTTAWPFLAALAVGWIVSLAWQSPAAPVRTGLPVWAVAVAGGMALRVVAGQGVSWPFVIVTTLVLAVALVGWRLVVAAWRRRASGPSRA